jgi:hypothetical protein
MSRTLARIPFQEKNALVTRVGQLSRALIHIEDSGSVSLLAMPIPWRLPFACGSGSI